MNKYIYGLAIALVLMTTGAIAEPGGSACEQHPNAPFCGGGEGDTNAGQTQGQRQNTESNAIGVGIGYGEGGSARQGQSQSSRNDNRASSDSQSGAISGSIATNGGNKQGVAVDARDQSTIVYEDADNPVSTAASVFAQQCQTGMSGQLEGGGFSVVNSDAFCDNIQAAQLMQAAYFWELEYGNATCTDEASIDHGDGALADLCINEQAEIYLEAYHYHIDEATELVRSTAYVAWTDRVAGMLMRPMAVIGVLILLL